jgi:hypothetical protein
MPGVTCLMPPLPHAEFTVLRFGSTGLQESRCTQAHLRTAARYSPPKRCPLPPVHTNCSAAEETTMTTLARITSSYHRCYASSASATHVTPAAASVATAAASSLNVSITQA